MASEDLEQTMEQLNAAMQALVAAINPAVAAQLEKTKEDIKFEADRKKTLKNAEDNEKKLFEKKKKEEEARNKKITELAETGIQQFVRIFTSAGTAMYKGEKGMKAFNTSVDAAAGSMVALVGVVGLLTGGVSLVTAGITAAVTATIAGAAEYVKAAAEQSDKLYDAFQDMSRAGAAGADGLQGVYSDMQKFGLGIQDLGKMSELLKSNSQSLALFGGTVFQGRKKFADVSQAMEPFRASLMNAGMTQDEINEATAGYIKLQSRLGTTQNRNVDELADSTRKYLLEQEALTKVTGLNRKEQESVREKALSRERFAGKILELQQKGDKASLDAAERLQKFMVLIENSGLEEGMADAATNASYTAESVKAWNATMGQSRVIMDRLIAGQIDEAQATDMLRKAMGTQVVATNASVRAQQGVYEQYNGNLYKQMGFINKGVDATVKAQGAATAQLVGQGATGKKAFDAELQRQTQMRLTQQKAMMNTQDFVRAGVTPATKALSWFGKTVEYITSLLPFAGETRQEMEQQETPEFKAKERAEQELYNRENAVLTAREKLAAAKTGEEQAVAKKELDNAEKNKEAAETQLRVAKDVLANTALNVEATEQLKNKQQIKDKAEKDLLDKQNEVVKLGEKYASAKSAEEKEILKKELETAEKNAEAAEISLKVAKDVLANTQAKGATANQRTIAKGQTVGQKVGAFGLGLGGGIAGGAMAGAALGSVVPVLGTAVGALVGATAGVIAGHYAGGAIGRAVAESGVEGTETSKAEMGKTILGNKTSTLDERMASAIERVAGEYKTITGKTIDLQSGRRTYEQQAQMVKEWQEGGGGPNKPTVTTPTFGRVTTPAQPGSSKHERGMAVDVNQADADAMDQLGLLSKYGLARPHKFDPVHIELAKYEAGGMLDGIGLVGEKGPELAVGQASITSNNDIMGAFRAMNAELSSQTMMLAEIARATKASSTANEKMLKVAQN